MARTNKYTSINFNHVIEKNLTASSSGSHKNPHTNHQSHSSFTSYSSATHGRMLVLTRPSPKPLSTPPVVSPTLPKQPQPRSASVPDHPPSSDQISLRPGSGISISGPEKKEKDGVTVSGSVKSGRFVPPHLRPGFAGKEEKPEPKVFRGREQGVKHFGSSAHYGKDRRPKSSGYENIKRGGDSDLGLIPRPRSSGNGPSSSG
ncbi:uncharacterized protein LOC120151566 [Hibiscus syriacus]|uniref:uncharacterized protein LOC120151566 n=1 Tax=Hibiscus syriacus TaxID=106335 RepID=UPI001920FF3C|nr:uncharacterized protein LOC120151566 [Hibiscus syriacus]